MNLKLDCRYFKGDKPSLTDDVFEGDTNLTLHYLPGAKGWAEEVSGRVMFLSMRTEAGPPAKTPDQRTAPGSADPQTTPEQNP